MTELIVIRHAETDHNANGIAQGHLDVPLNETGRKQAAALSERLEGIGAAKIYSSDLERSMNTAKPTSQKANREIALDERLRERHMGIFQGVYHKEAPELFPEVYAQFQAFDPDYVVPEGESMRQFYKRSLIAFTEIARAHQGEKVLVFTHGGNLGVLLRETLALPIASKRKYSCDNTSVSRFHYEKNEWKLKSWGDISHIKENASNT